MKRRSVALVVGLMCLVLAMGASATEVEEQTFPLTADGSVSLDNAAGETVIHAWDKEEVRMIITRKGSGADRIKISLFLPSDIDAEVDIRTTSGRISTDFGITVEGTFDRNELRGTIGAGGILIRLRASSGDVSLRSL